MLITGLTVYCAAGCGSRVHVELVPLNYRSIDPPAPSVAELNLGRCWWWTDDDERLWIAMEYDRASLLGRYARFVFQMSLALEELPAGQARNYKVTAQTVRAVARVGPTESRFTSATGIVAVYRTPNEGLRGSFRVLTRRQVSRLLGGWGQPSHYLIQGTFDAVRDAARGQSIAEATEAQGWERRSRRGAAPRQEEAPASSGPTTGGGQLRVPADRAGGSFYWSMMRQMA